MMKFEYHLPVKIHFGYGSSLNVKQLATPIGDKCFIIADSFVVGTDYFEQVRRELGTAVTQVWDKVQPNPTTHSVNDAAYAGGKLKPDYILAIGGGSCMDTAKAASLAMNTGRKIEDFHTGGYAYPDKTIPVIAIPTTAGTGSEVTCISVLNDESKHIKAPVAAKCMYPAVAIVDPEWTLSMPSTLTAITGLDALSHAIEGYWSKGAFAICDIYAEKAAQLIFESLETAINDGSDRAARENMALGSLLAGMAFGQPKNAAVHACSFPLSSHYHMPHGVACAFTLDHFINFNSSAITNRMLSLAKHCGFDDICQMAQTVKKLKKLGSLPSTFTEAGVSEVDIQLLVKESFHPLIRNNPREVTAEDLRLMYKSLI